MYITCIDLSIICVIRFQVCTEKSTKTYWTRIAIIWSRYIILNAKYYCGHRWLFPEQQQGIYGQNVVNAILPVSWLGCSRVSCNAESRIFRLNQNVPLHHHKKHLTFSSTHIDNQDTKILNLCPKHKIFLTKYSSPLAIGVCSPHILQQTAKAEVSLLWLVLVACLE